MNIPLETSMDELIEKSDVLIVLSPDNPEQHLRLSEAALKSGKRTYIDKTFAPDAETARAIFDIADKYGTPCWSSSALRFADVYKDVPKAISRLQAFGGGEFKMYLIHQLEPIVKLMGCDIKRVMSVGNDKFPSILIEFKDGRTAETNQYNGADFSMKLGYCDGSYSEFKVGVNSGRGASTVSSNSSTPVASLCLTRRQLPSRLSARRQSKRRRSRMNGST